MWFIKSLDEAYTVTYQIDFLYVFNIKWSFLITVTAPFQVRYDFGALWVLMVADTWKVRLVLMNCSWLVCWYPHRKMTYVFQIDLYVWQELVYQTWSILHGYWWPLNRSNKTLTSKVSTRCLSPKGVKNRLSVKYIFSYRWLYDG